MVDKAIVTHSAWRLNFMALPPLDVAIAHVEHLSCLSQRWSRACVDNGAAQQQDRSRRAVQVSNGVLWQLHFS